LLNDSGVSRGRYRSCLSYHQNRPAKNATSIY
jgi:hypothetical protein